MKIISKTIKILPLLLFLFALQSCSNDDDNNPIAIPQELNIVERASATPTLSSLVAALQAADGDLDALLSGDGPFTVLAPTNDAFASFLSENNFADLNAVPTDVLAQVLLNHVITGNVTSTDLLAQGNGYTQTNADGAGGQKLSLYFNTSGDVTFGNGSTVTSADIDASNGTIHMIDQVIGLPNLANQATANPDLSSLVDALTAGGNTTFTDLLSSSGDFTVFAPNNAAFSAFTNPNNNAIPNVLSNHVIVGTTALSGDLSNSYVPTAAVNADDDALSLYINTDDGVRLNGTTIVTQADIIATNGVLHIVDSVIDLPTIVDHALANPGLTSLVAALTRADQPDFVGILSSQDGNGPDPFTVFAPLNSAFETLLESNPSWNSLADIDGALLTSVLQHHVIGGANVRAEDLTDGISPMTLEGDMITINLPGNDGNAAKITDGSGNADIDIVLTNIQAYNGTVHAIESVLIPDTTN